MSRWGDRFFCMIFRHDILWGRLENGTFVKVRCFQCNKRWDR